MKLGKLLHRGKVKDVYETDNPSHLIIKFRDDITAGDGAKKDKIHKKGYYCSIISAKLFKVLEENGINTHFIKLLKPRYMLVSKLKMIPLEVIVRNIATGSIVKRYPFKEGEKFKKPIVQMDYKSDEYGDPMLNDDIAEALGIANKKELKEIKRIALKANEILKKFLDKKGFILPDIKFEFGIDENGKLVLGDEISPDTCRLWEKKTKESFDKDIFRKGRSGVGKAYKRVAEIIGDKI
ncbi:phosphoribosylaminoimidazole-succinocarboxamide synthase [Methanothermus fervidus DSM 2088]|uniref:Phosphoribosylaminoimidazole-succinocarboxamide synthase n=1 Tax=Methanothermus fervidus (strain ATCC 43054 / DSM 2088 / JCM 10308 / V24 S) TaxID=523846 RepID=E3GX93_METFV|nr:phosphoribosylaminoimidazolesuccinocarboxamide synthase [Methanothermus fervidus]ADP78088.1 phosphoribosylaminoimidazole-succinocarboxamide synthase [Methanothermus fervidus DSM 2088]